MPWFYNRLHWYDPLEYLKWFSISNPANGLWKPLHSSDIIVKCQNAYGEKNINQSATIFRNQKLINKYLWWLCSLDDHRMWPIICSWSAIRCWMCAMKYPIALDYCYSQKTAFTRSSFHFMIMKERFMLTHIISHKILIAFSYKWLWKGRSRWFIY